MHPAVRRLLLLAVLIPSIAYAQDPPGAPHDTPAETPEERPTGLPSKMTWTFNFDAGWGTFGFANSLYDNPKEPGVDENLSDQWFEGYMKPALSASYTLASSSEVYGKISAVGERTYGSMPADFGRRACRPDRAKALTTAAVQMTWMNGWSASTTFEGEFSNVTRSYAGKGVVRYAW